MIIEKWNNLNNLKKKNLKYKMSQKSMSQSSYGAIGGAYEPESIRL